MTTKLVKHLIVGNIQGDPSLKPNQIISLFENIYGSNIKYHHARRGRENVFGHDEKSYSDLVWYVKAIEETNPYRYVNFEVDHGKIRFHRLFIFFGPCKHRYKYLRLMIYLDATFLTGRFRGDSMAATCVNGNNDFYLYVYAFVSAENKENCYCFYHIKCNLPIGSGDANYNVVINMFYKAAHSYTTTNFDDALRGLFQRRNGKNAFFPVCRYGTHFSYLAKSFNNCIVDLKKLPAYALLDAIRLKIMRKNAKRMTEGLENFKTRLTPIYEALLEENIDIGCTWTVWKISVRTGVPICTPSCTLQFSYLSLQVPG
ncbi:uncharacterized protein LOC113294754 [Papaver somniferum]|uniref:uncharacterized protein LOC113294754 n=1 Tax=Papaver somniferum TaxID=3469 RepID=UPI000E6F7533|nr:uncharacterized protein LOC113294754 [Papaver somniferum]